MTQKKRILFFAEGVTMAHLVRPLSLADSLDPAVYDVHVFAPRHCAKYLQGRAFRSGVLDCMPGAQFLKNLAHARPMFPADVIRGYVRQDRQIISELKPDLVIGDMRPSLAISAALEKIPSAVIMNGYWSPYALFKPSIIPELGKITRLLPPRYFGPLYRLLEPGAFRNLVQPTNQIRREFGLPELPPDLGRLYTAGDYVLYADIPEFVETASVPREHCFVGPCFWTPPVPKPPWWGQMTNDPKPKVLVALGSSGPLAALPSLLRALARLPVSVILATSGRAMPATAPGTYIADLVPLAQTAALSAVVVSHGGSPGVYPSLAAGTPVLAIPSNGDQHLCTALLQRHQAGLGVRAEEASETRLFQALERLLNDPLFRVSAAKWKDLFAHHNSGAMFRAFLQAFFP